jgi:hypothetical protein
MTELEFIEKATKVHGTRYDYSELSLTRASDKVSIICPIHGVFRQKAYHHYPGIVARLAASTAIGKTSPAGSTFSLMRI